MIETLNRSWALLLGIMLLMVGNGIQGTLLGIRGALEGFSTFQMSIVMAGYFVGFLGGSRLTPELIRRVGHVRVFAALASMVSAVLILYPTFANPVAWFFLRVMIGFCFSGVYVTAESWLNSAATNETRGQALSLYLIVQMAGVVSAQALLLAGDPSGFVLFVIPSVLVSIAFAPILLSVSPTPAFETAKPLSFMDMFRRSPLSCVGMFLLGGVFSAQFGMASVYGAEAGFSIAEISTFVAAIYIGGLVMQYPIGYISDRMDRRRLILIIAVVGGIAAASGIFAGNFNLLLLAAFLTGGCSNPLYALLIAYTNDYLESEDMAAASGRLVFISGVGAIIGPLLTGWLMGVFGPPGFFVFISALMITMALYAVYRTTQRPAPSIDDTGSYAPITPTFSPVAAELAQDYYIESAEEDDAQNPADGAEDTQVTEWKA